jgi:hypothetical protein
MAGTHASRSPVTLPAVLLLSITMAACGGSAGSTAPAAPSPTPAVPASVVPSAPPVLSLSSLDATPIQHEQEAVAVAFDSAAAASLLQSVPASLDFARDVLVCVFLGPRQTTGWSLDLRSVSLAGNEVDIRARESAPRTGTERPEVTYPADCALLNRDALPVGEVMVRADDTITGEFIAGTTVQVPEASNAP